MVSSDSRRARTSPEYTPIVLTTDDEGAVRVRAEFLELLGSEHSQYVLIFEAGSDRLQLSNDGRLRRRNRS
jgi:hypothetical protein